jgi:hypothetical protein
VPVTTADTPSTPRKIQRELGWTPAHKFEQGIRETIRWYLGPAGMGQDGAEEVMPCGGPAVLAHTEICAGFSSRIGLLTANFKLLALP